MQNDLEENPFPPQPKLATAKALAPPPPKPLLVKPRPHNDGEEALPSPKSHPKPTRPKDVSNWKRDDYYSAKRDADPRLVAAVVRLGKQFADKKSAAELLTKLLESSATEPLPSNSDDEDGSHPTSTTSTKLTQALVAALVANGTPYARKTLEDLITGTLKTANLKWRRLLPWRRCWIIPAWRMKTCYSALFLRKVKQQWRIGPLST